MAVISIPKQNFINDVNTLLGKGMNVCIVGLDIHRVKSLFPEIQIYDEFELQSMPISDQIDLHDKAFGPKEQSLERKGHLFRVDNYKNVTMLRLHKNDVRWLDFNTIELLE